MGETIVDLRELVESLASLIGLEHPAVAPDAQDLARRWIIESWRELPRKPGEEFISEFTVASHVLARLLQDRGITIGSTEAGEYLRRAWGTFERRVRLCNGITKEWLVGLRRLTAGLGIVTDGDTENVTRIMDRLRLKQYFNAVVTSEAVRTYKPNPEIYKAALVALNAKPDRTLFVSDTPLDLQGAAHVGMAVALLRPGLLSSTTDVPKGALRLGRPGDLYRVLLAFAQSGHFENPA